MYAKIDTASPAGVHLITRLRLPLSLCLSFSSRLPLLPLVCSSSRYCLFPVPPLSVSQGNRQSFKQTPSTFPPLRLRHLRRCLGKVLWAHLDNKSLQVEDCRLRCLRTRPDSSLFSAVFPLCCVCSFFFLTHVRHVNFYFLLISLNDFFFFFAQAFFGYVFALSPFLPVSLSPCLSCLCLAIVWVLFWVLCLSRGLCLFCLQLIWRAYVGSAFFALASPLSTTFGIS